MDMERRTRKIEFRAHLSWLLKKRSLRYAGIAFLKVFNVVTLGFLKYFNVYGHKHICTMR